MLNRTFSLCLVLLVLACPAFCQINADFGANPGTDGVFAPTANTTVDLSAAPTAAWDSAGHGAGVYDPAKWAVVYKYTSVNIPGNVTVNFNNNAATAPVVWLVSGNVTINGAVNLDGQAYPNNATNSIPGPGGFRGGIGGAAGRSSGGGMGIGGGFNSSGSYGTQGDSKSPTYGNAQIFPLIGGSGGAGTGGAGGGAILIVALGTISINGSISANGGGAEYSVGGSAGGIRIVATALTGVGSLIAAGNSAYGSPAGGFGRIRLEVPTDSNSLNVYPYVISVLPNNPVKIWPDSSVPTVKITSFGSAVAPADPHANLDAAADVRFNSSSPQTVTLETTNIPPTGKVTVRVTPKFGDAFTVDATFVTDDGTKATWKAQITFPSNYCAVQAHALVAP